MSFVAPAISAFKASAIGSSLIAAAPYLSAGFSVIQGIGQGRAQQQLAAQQAAQLEQQAKAQEAQSQFEIQQVKKQNRAFTGQQLAAFGKSGLDISGSPLDVLGSTLFEQELDILTRRYNNRIGVSRTLGQAQSVRSEGAVSASRARSEGYATGFDTLLSRGLNG